MGQVMDDVSKEQEQAIARSTMYLVAALLSILMIFIAGLFLSAELEQQALQKAETAQQIEKDLPRTGATFAVQGLLKPGASVPPLAPEIRTSQIRERQHSG